MDFKPFKPAALESISRIIGEHYSSTQITDFFSKAGFPDIKHDGSTKWRFVSSILTSWQLKPENQANIFKIIEQLCDPQEYLLRPELHIDTCKQVNHILSFYGLYVDDNGKISELTKKSTPSQDPHKTERGKNDETQNRIDAAIPKILVSDDLREPSTAPMVREIKGFNWAALAVIVTIITSSLYSLYSLGFFHKIIERNTTQKPRIEISSIDQANLNTSCENLSGLLLFGSGSKDDLFDLQNPSFPIIMNTTLVFDQVKPDLSHMTLHKVKFKLSFDFYDTEYSNSRASGFQEIVIPVNVNPDIIENKIVANKTTYNSTIQLDFESIQGLLPLFSQYTDLVKTGVKRYKVILEPTSKGLGVFSADVNSHNFDILPSRIASEGLEGYNQVAGGIIGFQYEYANNIFNSIKTSSVGQSDYYFTKFEIFVSYEDTKGVSDSVVPEYNYDIKTQSKSWYWKGAVLGDCIVLVAANLKLFSDGRWQWDCHSMITGTTDGSGPQFKINILDKNGAVLFGLPSTEGWTLHFDELSIFAAFHQWAASSESQGLYTNSFFKDAEQVELVAECGLSG